MNRQMKKHEQKAKDAFMKAMTDRAPAGIMELYHSVLARGPVGSMATRLSSEVRERIISQTKVELTKLHQETEVLRITSELDSGMYFMQA